MLAGGWCYVKELVQPKYAEPRSPRPGIAALLFDYRRLGGSAGEPRQHLDPHDQIEDYRNALSYLEAATTSTPSGSASGASPTAAATC